MPRGNIDRRQFCAALGGLPIACLLPARLAAKSPPAPVADISALVEAERARVGIPALGAAVADAGGLRSIGVAGVRAFPDGPAAGSHDRWHIGSCTKAFTATLAARLIERGLLRWDSTIGQVLGGDIHAGWRDVQLLWLLSHRSGAEGNFDQALWERTVKRGGPLRRQRADFVAEGLLSPPSFAPNTRTSYSNAGYMIAGAMLEKAADTAWEALIAQEICIPLGLEDWGFGAPGTPGRIDQPLGHIRGDNRWIRRDLGPGDDNPPLSGPAGTLNISLPDWSKFAAAHLRGERGDETYLRSASWRRLHVPAESDWAYAPGWIASRLQPGGEAMLQHLGSNNFFVAQATLLPARNLAILLVTNVADDVAKPAFDRLLERLESPATTS